MLDVLYNLEPPAGVGRYALQNEGSLITAPDRTIALISHHRNGPGIVHGDVCTPFSETSSVVLNHQITSLGDASTEFRNYGSCGYRDC